MEQTLTTLGDRWFTATIDGKFKTREKWSHSEGARQEAEFAIRRLEEAMHARDNLKANLLQQYAGDEEIVEAILRSVCPIEEVVNCYLEKI